MNKSWFKHTLAIAALACGSASAVAADFPYDRGQPLDKIIVLVEDDVIAESEVDREVNKLKSQLRGKGQLPPDVVIRKQAIEQLINLKLQLAAAEKRGIKVDEATITRAVANIAKRNKLTIAELQTALRGDGMSMAQFRENLRRQIVLSQLRSAAVLRNIQISEAEIKSYLANNTDSSDGRTEFRLSHILIPVAEGASTDEIARAKAKATRLATELRAGKADFGAVAQLESKGINPLGGGDMGWRKSSDVPTLFAELANSLPKGGIGGPLRNSSGFHIIRLTDFKGAKRSLVEQSHVRHILIRTSDKVSDDQARAKLEQLRLRAVGGDDFANLARSSSDDRGSALKGGDLGWVSPGDLPQGLEAALAKLKPGEFTQPIRTLVGWHVAQLLARRSHDNTLEVRRSKARQAIRKRKAVEAKQVYLRRLRDEAYIEILPGAGI